MIAGIYKIEDKKGKIYVGSSVDIDRRWKGHQNQLASNKHGKWTKPTTDWEA